MKILVVHQNYLSSGQPGGSRFNEFARLWQNAGHQVVVIAGALDYASGTIPLELRGQRLQRRMEEGVEVWRCHVPETYNRSYVGRMWAFVVFTAISIAAVLRVERPDVVIATSPPLTTGLTGWLASAWHRVPWVFEIRDLWPESAITTGVLREGSVLARLLYGLERISCRRANRVNVLTPAFAENLKRRGLVTSDKLLYVPNGADVEAFIPEPRHNRIRSQFGWEDRFVAVYAGAHGRANALSQLVDAASELRHRPDILIACIGDGPERHSCEEAARMRGLSNIQFLGAQPKSSMPEFINAADAGLAVLQKNVTFRPVYPNKIFDYMSCQRPIVLAIDGAARALVVDEAGAGLFAEPESGVSIAAAIQMVADDAALAARLGVNGRRWVLANATRSVLARRYLDALAELIAEPTTLDPPFVEPGSSQESATLTL